MFTLPDILYKKEKKPFLPFLYLHLSNESTKKSRLNFTQPCIAIILQGEKRVFGDGKYDSFRMGDLIMFKPGNYLGYEVIESDQVYSSLMMFFDPKKFFNRPISSSSGKFAVHRADDYVLHFGQSCELLLKQENSKTDETLHQIKFREFQHYVSSNGVNPFSFFYDGKMDSQINSFEECVERCWNSALSVEEIAFLCNMSLSSFKRSFERVYNESPGKWLKRKRLEQAAMLIKEFNKNPTEIYSETGYADYSSFSHSFKKQFGVGPKEYGQA